MRPIEKEVEIKFEYSSPNFHTAQLFVRDFELKKDQLILKLSVEQTGCKAKEACVTSEADNKEEVCCAPESGCC